MSTHTDTDSEETSGVKNTFALRNDGNVEGDLPCAVAEMSGRCKRVVVIQAKLECSGSTDQMSYETGNGKNKFPAR
jgi:hypothetical protein